MKHIIKTLGALGGLLLGTSVHAQLLDDAICRAEPIDAHCSGSIPELADACDYANSYLAYITPICETTVANVNDAVSNLIARGYVRVGEPQTASSSENCPGGPKIGQLQGCLNLTSQVMYSARLDQSVLVCAAVDPQATRMDMACGGGGGLNVAPLAIGRVLQEAADGSGITVTTTVTSHDLDGPLRSVTVENRMDPSSPISVPLPHSIRLPGPGELISITGPSPGPGPVLPPIETISVEDVAEVVR